MASTPSDHIPGVVTVELKEFHPWHIAARLFDTYTISFFLPFSRQVRFLSGDDILDHVLRGITAGLEEIQNILEYREHCGHDLLTVAAHAGHLEIVKFLHQKGLPLETESSSGVTPLLAAVGQKHLNVVSWLVENGVDINASNKDNMTGIHVAAFDGSTEIVRYLLQKGALVNAEDKDGRTALMAACQTGYCDIVQFLLSAKADIMKSAKCGKSAPYYAAVTGHGTCLHLLLKADESVLHSYDDENWSLLAVAAYHGNLKVVQLLTEAGADVNAQDKFGRTALMATCEGGHTHVADYLISHKALASARSLSGFSAFEMALLDDNFELAQMVATELDMDSRDSIGSTPLILACRYGNLPLVKLILHRTIKSDLNEQNSLGVSALLASCMSGNCDLTKKLLDNGADLNIKSKSSLNAYQIAFMCKSSALVEMLEVHFTSDLQQLYQSMVLPVAAHGDIDVLKQLHHKGCDVNSANRWGVRSLMLAAYYGNKNMARYLIENGADINDRNRKGMSAVAYAIEGRHHKMVDFLVGRGANLNLPNLVKKSLCHLAVEQRYMELLRTVACLGMDINQRDRHGFTPLMLAARNGWLNIVQFLVQQNADITKKCRNGRDAAGHASMKGHDAIYQYLKEQTYVPLPQVCYRSCYVDPLFRRHELPVFNACILGHLPKLIEEYEKGFQINSYSKQALTPLHYASYCGQEEIVKWLLQHGANPNCFGVQALTPLMLACANEQKGIIRQLVEHKCLLNLAHQTGHSALIIAAHNGHTSVVKCLLTLDAEVDIANVEDSTPLNEACLKGYLEMVRLLVEYGAKINRKDVMGRTPLMAAARKGHTKVVSYLLEQSAELSLTCGEGKTAFNYARQAGHHEICELIKSMASTLGIEDQAIQGIETREGETLHMVVQPENQPGFAAVGDAVWPSEGPHALTLRDSDSDEEPELSSVNGRFLRMCEYGAESDSLQTLLEDPSLNINVTNSEGETGLILAVKEENSVIARTLIQHGAQIDCRDNTGRTALMHAVSANNLPTVMLLVEDGRADFDILDNEGNHVISLANAVAQNEISVASEVVHNEILMYLLTKREDASDRHTATDSITRDDHTTGDEHDAAVCDRAVEEVTSNAELVEMCVWGKVIEVGRALQISQPISSTDRHTCLSYAAASVDVSLLNLLMKTWNIKDFLDVLTKQCIEQDNEHSVDVLLDGYSKNVDELQVLLSRLCSDHHIGLVKKLCSKLGEHMMPLVHLCQGALVKALEKSHYKLSFFLANKWLDLTRDGYITGESCSDNQPTVIEEDTSLLFRNIHSPNVKLSADRWTAKRMESSCRSICFGSRPVEPEEPVYIRCVETSTDSAEALKFGFTSINPADIDPAELPKYSSPDLTRKPDHWVTCLPESTAKKGSNLCFYFTQSGDCMISLNGEDKGVVFSGLDVNGPLYPLVDICGAIVAVEFVGRCTGKTYLYYVSSECVVSLFIITVY